MRVVLFNAGLGNQIFTYLFCHYLRRRFPNDKLFGCYWSGGLNVHEGLEVDKVFDVTLPTQSFFTDMLGKAYRVMTRIGMRPFLEKHEFAAWNIVFDYYWLDQQYYKDEDIKKVLPFREDCIDKRNKQMAEELCNCCSIAVHIRRGDYMTEENYRNFGQFCTEKYYYSALNRMMELYPDCRFYFFSDDINYVRAKYNVENATYIDWNKGQDSWKDMYLMSRCKHHIIANSTFSYWGAMLAENDDNKVIAPKKWYIWDDPDIFPEKWERI